MTTTHNYVMFFTNIGRVYRLKAYQIPEASRTSRGMTIVNLLQLALERKYQNIPVKDFEDEEKSLFIKLL